jgi:hypothetical protein
MAWTQADVDALKAAIATGARSVRYGDKTVEYRSLDEMRQVLRDMQDEVSPATAGARCSYATFSKD